MRSWQYDSAVSEIANSSSVKRLLLPSGSFQSKAAGVCAWRRAREADCADDWRHRLAVRDVTDLNMLRGVVVKAIVCVIVYKFAYCTVYTRGDFACLPFEWPMAGASRHRSQ
jgi:hypothetical protein